MIRIPLVVVAVMAAVVLPASACWACSCMPAEPEQYWEWADAVFDGAPTGRSEPDANGMITWTFEVVDVWKGDVGATQQLQSHQHGATCGLSFELGVTYRVYATGSSDAMETNLCSGSAPRDQFAAGPPAEAAGEPTTEPTAGGTPTDGSVDPTGPDEPVTRTDEPPPGPTATPTVNETTGGEDLPEAGNISVPAGDSNTGLVATVAVAGGLGLLGLAVWLARRGQA